MTRAIPKLRDLPQWLRMARETPEQRGERLALFAAYKAVTGFTWLCHDDQVHTKSP